MESKRIVKDISSQVGPYMIRKAWCGRDVQETAHSIGAIRAYSDGILKLLTDNSSHFLNLYVW